MAMASGAVGRFPVPSVKSKAGAAPKRIANDIAKEVAQKKTKEMKAKACKRKRGGRRTDEYVTYSCTVTRLATGREAATISLL